MKYFKDILGSITYDGETIINIFKKVNFDFIKNSKYLIEYVMKDGETPETISKKLYDTTDLWWTIMIINKRYDRFFDYVIPSKELEAYITFLIDEGEILSTDTTEMDRIRTTNDQNRYIYIIDKKFIRRFLYQVKELIGG